MIAGEREREREREAQSLNNNISLKSVESSSK
jgi:hypothetical protein